MHVIPMKFKTQKYYTLFEKYIYCKSKNVHMNHKHDIQNRGYFHWRKEEAGLVGCTEEWTVFAMSFVFFFKNIWSKCGKILRLTKLGGESKSVLLFFSQLLTHFTFFKEWICKCDGQV